MALAAAVRKGKVESQHGVVRESQAKLQARFPNHAMALIPELVPLPEANL